MKSRVAAVLVAFVVAGVLVTMYAPDGSILRFGEPTPLATPVKDVALAKAANVSPVPASARVRAQKPSAFANIPNSRVGLSLVKDPFGASSIEEQRWLDRNGYPNEKQWLTYKTASDSLIAQAAESGDKIAVIELDARRLMKGDQTGRDGLMKAAVEGSQYALETLASYLASSSSGDPKSAYMLYRYGEMRGNLQLGMPRDLLVEKLSPTARLEAEASALKLFTASSNAQRARLSPGARFVDPRPIGPKG